MNYKDLDYKIEIATLEDVGQLDQLYDDVHCHLEKTSIIQGG
jgi:hypothetical protein